MTAFVAEIIGTFLLILLGGGVVANVVLGKTKSNYKRWLIFKNHLMGLTLQRQ